MRKPKQRPKQPPPARRKSSGKSHVEPALHGVAVHPEMRGRGPAPGAPNAGRPKKATRALFLDILMTDGVAAAREVLRGEPDKQGRVPTHADRLAWLIELSEIGLNTKTKIARIEAQAAAAAPAGVQIVLQGGPAGNLQPE